MKAARAFRSMTLGFRLARLLRPHASGCGGGFVLAALMAVGFLAFRLAQPWPLKWIIDGLGGHATPFGIGLFVLGGSYVLFAGGAALCEYAQRRTVASLSNRMVYRFRGDLFRHVVGLHLPWQERRGTGELLTRIVWDTGRVRRGVAGVLLRLYQNGLLFVATVAVLVWISPLLSLVILAAGLAAFLVMFLRTRLIHRAARNVRRREGRLASVVEENLRGARDVQTFAGWSDPRFARHNDRSVRGEQKLVRLEASLLLFVEMLMAAAVCAILWGGTQAIAADRLTTGDLVLFVHYALALHRPFTQFARQAAQAGRTAACAERLMRLKDRRPAVEDGPAEAPAFTGALALENVSLKADSAGAGGREWLLKDVSLRLAPGERVAVMGANGAGKSTLLRMFLRLWDPDAGRVTIDGRDAREFTLASLRRGFSVLHQDAVLLGLSVGDNLRMGRPEATDAEVFAALEAAGIAERVRSLPNGLDSVVRGARTFSVGERQRLALARAILAPGTVWLLDEPCAGLDRADRLVDRLLELTEGRTAVWVTHDPRTAEKLDRIVMLDRGRIPDQSGMGSEAPISSPCHTARPPE